MTGLFKSKKYDHLSHLIRSVLGGCHSGRIAKRRVRRSQLYRCSRRQRNSNDYHPKGSVLVAEQFVARVHDALKNSPQWDRMVFVLNFDEHGGFFDHVPPPACRDDTCK